MADGLDDEGRERRGMSDLLVIVPSRGRPANITDLAACWPATGATADLLVVTDDDDPAPYQVPDWVRHEIGPRRRLGPTLNAAAVANADRYRLVGFMGDDHRPRTPGWDEIVSDEFDRLGTGIVYGNDLLQGQNLPTAVFMSASIVTALGRMVPDGLVHLFLDNYWADLGRELDALSYLPEVVIEHLHPAASKAASDAGYVESNSWWGHDQRAYSQFVAEGGLVADADRVRRAA